MIRVETIDGALFIGPTMAAVVRAMKREAWNAPERKTAYMHEVVERVEDMTQRLAPAEAKRKPGPFLRWLHEVGAVKITGLFGQAVEQC